MQGTHSAGGAVSRGELVLDEGRRAFGRFTGFCGEMLLTGQYPRALPGAVGHPGYFGAFAVVAAVCVAFDLLLPPKAALVVSGPIYLAWSLWLVRREAISALLGLNPVVCYQLWQAGTLGAAPLYIGLTYWTRPWVSFGDWPVPLEWVVYGHAIMVVGSCAFYAGMKRFQPCEFPDREAIARAPSILAPVAAASLGVAVYIGRESVMKYAGSTVVQLELLPLAALCMIALKPPRFLQLSHSAQFCVLVFGSFGLLVLNARYDSKMSLMFSFLPLVWWLVKRKRVGALLVVGTAITAFYLLVVAPLVTVMRVTMWRERARVVRTLTPVVTREVAENLRRQLSANPAAYLQQWLDATMHRMCDPVAAGIVAGLAEKKGFLLGRGLDYVPMALVPRALWPQKPFTDRGRHFTAALGWAPNAAVATTSTGQTSAGELYWNFGWPGVVIGMYLLGAAVAGLWWGAAGSDPRRGLLQMTVFLGATLSFVAGGGAAAGPMFTGSLASGLLWRAVIRLRESLSNPSTRHIHLSGAPSVLSRHADSSL